MHERVNRLIERAQAEGLVDVAYAETDTPVGRLLVAATPRGLVRVSFQGERAEDVLAELSASGCRRGCWRRRPGWTRCGASWTSTSSGSRRQVRAAARLGADRQRLPAAGARAHGADPLRRTTSYRDVATAAGNERAVRAAGTALGANPIPIVVPCHRVLRTGGGLGGYGGGLDAKRYLLDLEAGRGG